MIQHQAIPLQVAEPFPGEYAGADLKAMCYRSRVINRSPLAGLPPEVEVMIEYPRGARVKWRPDGRVDFISPIGCPYNYGSIPGRQSGDGEALDAVVMGPTLPRGACCRVKVVGVLDFLDAGEEDPKVICSPVPLTLREQRRLIRFFRVYTVFKGLLHRARGRTGETRFRGYLPRP